MKISCGPRKFAAAAAALFLSVSPAAAQSAVVCTNCGTEWTQLFEWTEQLEKQAGILQTANNQYSTMVTNTTPLLQQYFGDAAADFKAINAALGGASSPVYSSSNLSSVFSTKYSTYQEYQKSLAPGKTLTGTMDRKRQQWSTEAKSSVQTTLSAAKLVDKQITTTETTLIDRLAEASRGANGQLAAIHVTNQLGVLTAQQLQKLRQLEAVKMQLTANDIQRRADSESAEQAAWKMYIAPPNATAPKATGGKKY
jgi:P-type conjugative transfer protein TrbJ